MTPPGNDDRKHQLQRIRSIPRYIANRSRSDLQRAVGPVRRRLRARRGTFSQYGEDELVDRLLGAPADGFFVDIGAYDPESLSNTKRFYDRGWTGINVEPQRSRWERMTAARPRDVNLLCGIGRKAGAATFHEFEQAAVSTFSEEQAVRLQAAGYHLLRRHDVPIRALADVLDEHAADRDIDFLSVDAEGYDLEVVSSNDWERFRPRLVILEINQDTDRLNQFMVDVDYEVAATNRTNSIFRDARRSDS